MSGASVTVLFFARLREAMGTAELEVPLAGGAATADDVLSLACAGHPGRLEAVRAMRVRAAINQMQAPLDAPVRAGDEVAFFPPVTGG